MAKNIPPELWRLPLLPSAQAVCWLMDQSDNFVVYLRSLDTPAVFHSSEGYWKRAALQAAFTSWATYVLQKHLHIWSQHF